MAIIGVVPAAATAGQISGTVTAEAGGAPIAGEHVCQFERTGAVEESCTETDAEGHYSLISLPTGSYVIKFSGWKGNLPWIDEFYDNEYRSDEADAVALNWDERLTVDAQLAEGGSISGTVTDEGTGEPIAGVWACASASGGIPGRCAFSDAAGHYRLNGLRSGEYAVEFEGANRVNYLHEYYRDAESWAGSEKIVVEEPNQVTGIDAQLAPGAQILGQVTQVGTGVPVPGVFVCLQAVEGEFQDCEDTDAAGDYALRGLPAGSYLVGFNYGYVSLPDGLHAEQWWQGASSKAEATPITIAPPETRSGIDGQVAHIPYVEPPSAPPTEITAATSSPPPAPAVKPRISIRRGRVPVIHRHARVGLLCRAGTSGSCRGTVRLVIRRKLHRRGRQGRHRKAAYRTIVLGRARYSLHGGERKFVAVRLKRWALRFLRRTRHHRLRARSIVTLVGGHGAHRAIVLEGRARRRGARG